MARFTPEVFAFDSARAMELLTILTSATVIGDLCTNEPLLCRQEKHRNRRAAAGGLGSDLLGCRQPAPGYDPLPERRFEFIPLWGLLIFPLYRMRRVECREGKHQLTKAYMLLLARWARKLSWKETAAAFHTSWEKVCDAVEYVVRFGLEHRQLGVDSIGVDEIQYAKGHKYLTLVYQIDHGLTRLLWVGKERAIDFAERVRLLGHVGALSGCDLREMLAGSPHPGSLSHCRQDEQGLG